VIEYLKEVAELVKNCRWGDDHRIANVGALSLSPQSTICPTPLPVVSAAACFFVEGVDASAECVDFG
jgi:hypothetical protein